jgi:hypothetical protein
MERYLQIGKANLKFNLWVHLLLSLLFLGVSPLLMGVENLDASMTAKVLEMYIALIGIILLTPINLPEQNKDIRELIGAKYTSSAAVTIIRIAEAVLVLAILTGLYLLLLKHNNCTFPLSNYYQGTLAEALFLGGMGFFAYAVFDQIAIAYMLPLVYYILSMGNGRKLLKGFYLFSMSYGSYKEKGNLALLGIIMILLGICFPYLKRRILKLV